MKYYSGIKRPITVRAMFQSLKMPFTKDTDGQGGDMWVTIVAGVVRVSDVNFSQGSQKNGV